MPFNSSIYTDLELPSLNQDNSTYGIILNTYFQALETKLKNLSDRINAAGVGDSSTLAQINSDIDGILPDPYAGNYSTVSTWPAYNTELTALGLSPPQTGSEINTFFDSGGFATFANFLNGKLDSIDTILTTAESDIDDAQTDICKANLYSDKINDVDIEYELQSTTRVWFLNANTPLILSASTTLNTGGTLYNGSSLVSSSYGPSAGTVATATTAAPSITGKTLSDINSLAVFFDPTLGGYFDVTVPTGSTITINDAGVNSYSISVSLASGPDLAWVGGQWSGNASLYGRSILFSTYKLVIKSPDVSGCG
jgi:hypothetical protein